MIRKLISVFLIIAGILAVLNYRNADRKVIIDFKPFNFEPVQVDTSYSFFVAGHVYGPPGSQEIGFHPPFRLHIQNRQRSHEPVDFGILTGDVVQNGTQEQWSAIRNDIISLNVPVHIAVGNHDRNAPKFNSSQDKTYYTFAVDKDVFIILDPNLDRWNITGDQLTFLKETLQSSADARHIFVFTHQLIWWSPDSEVSCVSLNSVAHRNPTSNFYTEILPLLKELDSKVYWFAGDVGAFANQQPTYFEDANVHFIGSGMGGGNGTSLIVKVNGDDINVELVWLHSFGEQPNADAVAYINNNKPMILDYRPNCGREDNQE